MAELRFFNPYADIRFTVNRLPHWQQEGGVYFVTFRLADAVPHQLRTQWQFEREAWLRVHPRPWNGEVEREYHERFSGAIERWLDAGHGSCILRRRDCAEIVAKTLRHFDGDRLGYHFVCGNAESCAYAIRAKRKLAFGKGAPQLESFTSRKINSLLRRDGSLWQRDYFDRLVRDEKHFASCVRYIRRNPSKGHLRGGEFVLFESEIARNIE